MGILDFKSYSGEQYTDIYFCHPRPHAAHLAARSDVSGSCVERQVVGFDQVRSRHTFS